MESQIKELKQKYWEGNTSVEEERLLKKHFNKQTPSGMEDLFFAELEKQKSKNSTTSFSIPQNKTKILWQLSSAAATIIVLIALAIGFNKYNYNNEYIVNNPNEAYEISRQALLLVSSNLNKGKTYTTKIDKINNYKQTNKLN